MFGASVTSMGSTCVHLETTFGWSGGNELSFSVAVERKLDPRTASTMGSSFVGKSPSPLFQQVNRVMVLLAEGHGEGWCMVVWGKDLSIVEGNTTTGVVKPLPYILLQQLQPLTFQSLITLRQILLLG